MPSNGRADVERAKTFGDHANIVTGGDGGGCEDHGCDDLGDILRMFDLVPKCQELVMKSLEFFSDFCGLFRGLRTSRCTSQREDACGLGLNFVLRMVDPSEVFFKVCHQSPSRRTPRRNGFLTSSDSF